MVTSENLSPKAGLIAGGSLLVDYMLTVAVSVSSGADAITSAIPSLHPYNLHISILLVLLFDADEPSGTARIGHILDDSGLPVHRQYHCLNRLWRNPNFDRAFGL